MREWAVVHFRKILAALFLVCFLVFFTLSPYLEPYFVKQTEKLSITGFFGLEWGSSPTQVELYMRDLEGSSGVQHLKSSVNSNHSFLVYKNLTVLNVKTHVGFFFDENNHLVMGFFLTPFDIREDDCGKIYGTFREKIANDYPSLSVVRKKHNSLDAPLCHAVTLGKAGKAHHWSDPWSFAQIHLSVGYGLDRHILMIAASPEFARWLRTKEIDPTELIREQVVSIL